MSITYQTVRFVLSDLGLHRQKNKTKQKKKKKRVSRSCKTITTFKHPEKKKPFICPKDRIML